MRLRDAVLAVMPYGFVQSVRRRNKGVVGSYRTWDQALAATGPYQPDMDTLIDAVRRYRDDEPSPLNLYDPSCKGVSYPLLAGLLTASARCGGRLSVLDFGGSLGQTYFGLRYTLQYLPSPVTWCVVDQPECCEAGVRLFQSDRLRFYASVEEAAAQHGLNTVVCSGTLQYLDRPYETLDLLARLRYPNFIFDRTPISSIGTELIWRQHTPADMGGDVHPLRAVMRDKLDAVLTDHGYELHDDYSYGDYPMDGDAATYRFMMYRQRQRDGARRDTGDRCR